MIHAIHVDIGHPILKYAALAEVERTTRQTLLQNAHHRYEHLRADVRVELEVLLDRELGNLLESLMHKVLDLALLKISLLTVDVSRVTAYTTAIIHALIRTHSAVG